MGFLIKTFFWFTVLFLSHTLCITQYPTQRPWSFLQCESTDNNLDITQEKEDYESDNFSLESHLQLFEPFEGISVEIQTNEVDFLDEIPHKILDDTDSDDSGVETEGWFPTLYS